MLEVGRVPLLTRKEEQALALRLRDGEDMEAARTLVAANLRFVVKVAFEFKNYNIRMTDLIQEGNVGLMHAVSKFDPDRGYRLISYAVWWIKAYIQNFIIKNWSMVPVSARRKLLFGKKRLPGGEEVRSGDVDENSAQEAGYLIAAEQKNAPSKRELLLAGRDFSLDNTIGQDGGDTHLARLPSHEPDISQGVESRDIQQKVQEAIATVLDQLDDRGRYILEKRLLSDDPLSLGQIGNNYGISRERARQLEARVKKKLKKALQHLGDAEILE